MGIDGFLYLGIPLNLTEPAYLEHVSSVFLISLRFCWRNWTLLIGPFQLLNSSLYWSPRTTEIGSLLFKMYPRCKTPFSEDYIISYGLNVCENMYLKKGLSQYHANSMHIDLGRINLVQNRNLLPKFSTSKSSFWADVYDKHLRSQHQFQWVTYSTFYKKQKKTANVAW